MANSDVTPKSHVHALTGLRFLAALAVYFHHHPKADYFPDWLTTFFNAGYNGVTIFFVLSGFVICLNYFDSLTPLTGRALLKYAIARLGRIYPLYVLVLLYVWLTRGAPQTYYFIPHLLAIQTWFPDLGIAYGFNGPGWSIGVEFFLYACFPLIAIAIAPLRQHRKSLWLLALGTMTYLVIAVLYFHLLGRADLAMEDPESAHRWLYRTPLTRLGDFLLGMIAALLFKSGTSSSARAERRWNWLSYAACLGIALLMLWPLNYFSAFSWDAAYALPAFLLILGLARAPQTMLGRLLGSHPLVILGEASFALYLIHTPLMSIFKIDRYLAFAPWVAILLWIVFGAICIALSISLNKYVETPLRRAINHWGAQMIDRRATV